MPTVNVNNQATARKVDFFYRELAVDNSSGPAYPQINVVGAPEATSVSVAKTQLRKKEAELSSKVVYERMKKVAYS